MTGINVQQISNFFLLGFFTSDTVSDYWLSFVTLNYKYLETLLKYFLFLLNEWWIPHKFSSTALLFSYLCEEDWITLHLDLTIRTIIFTVLYDKYTVLLKFFSYKSL